ncbi:hypothetical protein F4777DRAFT_572682 [Nemania sp. FL0916]|nr:hypothetical protein F4777DRAFT_572682 [Nemania sp. FL0916]
MAEVEEPQFTSLADRIAALNKQKNFTAPPPVTKRAPPPLPNKHPISVLTKEVDANDGAVAVQASPSLPARRPNRREPPAIPQRTNTTDTTPAVESPPTLPGRPPLPSRKASADPTPTQTPTLPSRRPTHQFHSRRGSNSSEISHVSSISTLSLSRTNTSTTSIDSPAARRVLAPAFDQAKLPPLPPSRREKEAQAAKEAAERERTEVISPPPIPIRSVSTTALTESSNRPNLPPRLPSRPATRPPIPVQAEEEAPPTLPRRLPPPASAFARPKTILEDASKPPRLPPNRPRQSSPPPIPVSSRPTRAEIGAVAVRAAANNAAACLRCRDFSGPDGVAAQYPVHSLPRRDPVGYLANVLCASFSSPTDKARAIFTWCHHNIAYNVEDFFGGCVSRHDVDETIFMGKAVCQGYAEVFEAIALRAGLDCVVVSGHGKGYGYAPLKKGQAPPAPNPTGHAWNAVRIDNGEWKLVDACWGAGNVNNQMYNKHFSPKMFTMSNEHFGHSHFPRDDRHFYLEDRRILSWVEYITGPVVGGGERPRWCGDATEEGFSDTGGYSPAAMHIPVNSGEVVRFQISKVCEHWTHERNGKGLPYLLILKINGVDGRKEDLVPLDNDGFWWWVDVPSRDLGVPGNTVQLFSLTVVNGKDARGTTKEDYARIKGRCAYNMAGVCTWELV